jgi:hypothetical protein
MVVGPRRPNMTGVPGNTINIHCCTWLPHCNPIDVDPFMIFLAINRLRKIVRCFVPSFILKLEVLWRRHGRFEGGPFLEGTKTG